MRLLLACILFFLVSCSEPYPGFKTLSEGLYFKLHSIGDAGVSLDKAQFILMDYDFCENSDCVLDSLKKSLVLKKSASQYLGKQLSEIHIGDRISLLFENEKSGFIQMFNIEDASGISYPVIILAEVKAFHNNTSYYGGASQYEYFMKLREGYLINDWVKKEDGFKKARKGYYLKTLVEGTGDSVAIGRSVAISYKSYFYMNRLFDNTSAWNDSLIFNYGTPNQVIDGLDLAIGRLRAGSEAKIIIPSHLAFGKQGSSTGLVPPYEPLKYEIKILEVK